MPDSTETDNFGPRVANVHGYEPSGDPDNPHRQPDPNGLITITGWFTDEDRKHLDGETYPQWERRQAEKFILDAQAIYEVLSKNLPGGTLHQLLIQMLQGKLNLYVVRDVPDTTIKDIAELAREFAWKTPNWGAYIAAKGSPDLEPWFLLCQAVEKRYGPPPVEDH